MKYLAAFALLKLGGNAEPSSSDVEGFLKDNGVKADKEKINELIEKLGGKDFNKLVETGTEQLSAMGAQNVLPADVTVVENDEKVGAEAKIEEVDLNMGGLFDSDEDY